MTKFLFFIAAFILLLWGTFFYVPEVKHYGQTILQFEENSGSYFIEDETIKCEVGSLYYNFSDKMHQGLKVSYVQFASSDMVYVTPSMFPKAKLAKILHRISMRLIWAAFILFNCFFWLMTRNSGRKSGRQPTVFF